MPTVRPFPQAGPSGHIKNNAGVPKHASDCQKSLAEFAALAANRVSIIFCQDMRLTENTPQAASVEFVRLWRTNYARSRLQKTGGKARRGFSTSSSGTSQDVPLCFGCTDLFGRSWFTPVSIRQDSGDGVGDIVLPDGHLRIRIVERLIQKIAFGIV